MSQPQNILDKFALKFSRIVDKFTDYIIVSGFVAISSGRARATEDIDMIIAPIPLVEYRILHKDLVQHGFECLQSNNPTKIYCDYLSQHTSVRYVEKERMLPQMELKFARDALDLYQLNTKTKLPLTGLDLWFSNVNVNIAFKEHLLKSEKDLEDARHLRIVYPELVSEKEIRKVSELIERWRLKNHEKKR